LEAEEGGATFGFLEEREVGFEEEGCWDYMLEAALWEIEEEGRKLVQRGI
jgi:hypothetical protein